MLIVDETVEASSGDRTERIPHRPVKSFEEEKALYVRPLPREKDIPNLREIAGNKAFNYVIGKREYILDAKEDSDENPVASSRVITVAKWVVIFALFLSGAALVASKFGAF